ncbi:MAG: gluconate 2-dehydrogenase subunit 3 family protein [Acidobacteriaceae bacterium]|nr:gluconate 2-dehydrogenase subunit 3 family protein [Acidobacteriaceae bacterium]
MKRRKFVQSLLVAPAAPVAVAAAQQQTTTPQQQPAPQPNTPARQVPQQPQGVPKLAVVQPDIVSETDQRFFSADQFAALEKLGNVLMPPLKGKPGASEAHAPEFLDFLLSVSPADRQRLYRNGLDGLNAQAKKQFHKPFAELDSTQVDAVIRPLLVARPWPQELPSDPMKNFMAQVHEDLRTATTNSREWANTASPSGQRGRGFNRSVGYYWHPIDPVVRG